MKILNITISGFKNLKDNFNLNLIVKAKVSDIDLSDEVLEVAPNLYLNTSYIFTGKNSSGKTTVLELMNTVNTILSKGILNYDEYQFKGEKISLKFHFYENGYIYRYTGILAKPKGIIISENNYTNFIDEEIGRKKYYKSHGKHVLEGDYEIIEKSFSERTASLTTELKFKTQPVLFFSTDKFKDLSVAFYVMKVSAFNQHTINLIVNLFDNSIQAMTYSEEEHEYVIMRNNVKTKYREKEVNKVLSEGTLKGIIMFACALAVLLNGSSLIIDEIENSFHKNLIEHLVMLFMDKRINTKNAQLVFSTHYAEVLDVLRRRDGVFILKNAGKIDITNLYLDYAFRTETLKSNIVNNNEVDTLVKYDDIMKVKRAIINEISNLN